MKDLPLHLFQPVIGLEIHLQLNTRTKLFSGALNRFGDEPNTNISIVCTGQPGSLPVLNREAVRKGIQLGLALRSKINLFSRFDRKSYFYPDSPRNFQITQFEKPLLTGGFVEAEVDGALKLFQINRAHLEDDAGMLKHFSTFAGVDYNRAGAPLIEVVSEPMIHSAKEASAYAMAIRLLALYLDISDGNMEEGSLRIDANVSVRPHGEKALRPKVEIKNMNSFSFLEMAIDQEIARQVALYTAHPHRLPEELVIPGTYRWDTEKHESVLMRKKESAEDYRYFPEPDLTPLVLTQEEIDEVALALPELPHTRLRRYIDDLNLSPSSALLLVHDIALSNYFESALLSCPHPRSLCNWITVEFVGRLKDTGKKIFDLGLPPGHIALLVNLIEKGIITGKIGKLVADEMVKNPSLSPQAIIDANPDYLPIGLVSEIEPLVDQVLKDNPQSVADFLSGREKAFAFLVGQVMKLTKGKASPQIVNDLLLQKIRL